MRFKSVLLAGVMAIGLVGCSLRGKRQTSATPPPPKPATTAKTSAQPARPLSVPQTNVQLPEPQPVSPDALATAQAPVETIPAPPTHSRPVRRSPAASPARPEASPAASDTPVAPVQADEGRPRIQPIVPAQEVRRLQDEIEAHSRETRDLLNRIVSRRLSVHETNIVDRIRSFLTLSDQAAKRGDFRQADALSERALVLARELQNAK